MPGDGTIALGRVIVAETKLALFFFVECHVESEYVLAEHVLLHHRVE